MMRSTDTVGVIGSDRSITSQIASLGNHVRDIPLKPQEGKGLAILLARGWKIAVKCPCHASFPLSRFFWLSLSPALVPHADAATVFHYTSESGDYIGQGQERTITPAGGYTFQVSGSPGAVTIYITDGTSSSEEFYGVDFAAPTGTNLAVGNYPGATRYPFQEAGDPGLDFSANGAGSNTLTGQFQILDISFDANGTLATFAANFVQHSENAVAASYGQIRYNSSMPYLTPAGVANFAASQYGVVSTDGSLTVGVTRRDGSSGPLSVNYSTARGTDLSGRDYAGVSGTLTWANGDTSNRTITIPILNSGNPAQGDGDFFINLTGAGAGAQNQARVAVVNDNSSITFVHFVSDSGDYIGQGQERTFSVATRYVITAARDYSGGVSFSFDNGDYVDFEDEQSWDLELDAATGTIFGVGDYEDAERAAFHSGTHPGLELFGDGRGSNTLTGNFQVLEAQFDATGNVLKFAANFEQHSEGDVPALRGQVRYNSTVPLTNAPGTIQFSTAAYSVSENAGTATVTVNRTGGTLGALSASYATSNGSGIAGQDYAATTGTLNWASGDSTPKQFTIPITDRQISGGTRTVGLKLTGTKLGALYSATLTINEDDVPSLPEVSAVATTAKIQQDGTVPGVITVSRTGSTAAPLTVFYTLSGSALNGQDYKLLKGKKTILAGATSARVKVHPMKTNATLYKVTVKLQVEPQTGSYGIAGIGLAKVKLFR